MILDAWNKQILPISTKKSVISTIHKEAEQTTLTNHRPLSLTNTDYKIVTFVFAERMQNVLPHLINHDQVAYIKARYIGCNIRNFIDIFEYCEKNNEPGAFICIDFLKAFDSVEHNFMYATLKKFNFGNNFIKWIKLFYQEPKFKVKNNGWLSAGYSMHRGIRQGCCLSSLIFILVVEILALMIRQSSLINGIVIGNEEHKIIQYADDATICVQDLKSIENTISIVEHFSRCAGPKLNLKKTKGIWLGSLKDLGLRKYGNILWTGNPVKCLGIFIGHKKDKCNKLNWDRKLDKIENNINLWSKRNISLFGKVEVIKTHLLSKIIFPGSLLDAPEYVLARLKNMFFRYIWGKRDKVKRSTIYNNKIDGGLKMVHLESFFLSLKAVWVKRLVYIPGKWSSILTMYLKKLNVDLNYVLKMNFRKIDAFPILKVIPLFYQDVILAFNKAKTIIPFENLNKHEISQLPIWGSEYFKVGSTCLYMKGWIRKGILYVKDLVNNDGNIKNDPQLYVCTDDSRNAIHDVYIVKNYVIRKIRHFDMTIAPFVNIKQMVQFIHCNDYYVIKTCKTKTFYNMLVKTSISRGNMETIFARTLQFDNTKSTWKNIYEQKILDMKLPRIRDFNYKVLQNILPCAKVLSKWQNVSDKCELCNDIETIDHMLFNCQHLNHIWKTLSQIVDIDIKYKHVVCGFPNYTNTTKISALNYVFNIVAYAIFKEKSRCKFQAVSYTTVNFSQMIKRNIILYKEIVMKVKPNMFLLSKFDDLIGTKM